MAAAGADELHVDVMDGHFVPNLTMGPIVVEALERTVELPLDVHLMITNPGEYFEPFVRAGADHVTFHVEVTDEPAALIAALRKLDVGVGIAVNPETPVEAALDVAHLVDLVLVMTVHPGFGGQRFLGENLAKVETLRRWERQHGASFDVQVDGGIDASTIGEAARAGANVHVAGSAIFGREDAADGVAELRSALDGEIGNPASEAPASGRSA